MALLFMDGFGGGDINNKWDIGSNGNGYGIASAGPRVPGGYYYAVGGVTQGMIKSFTASNRIFVGFGLFTAGASYFTVYGDTGATQHITVVRNTSTGVLEIRRGNSTGTLLASGTQPIYNNQWNYVEVSVTISDTIGEVHVRLNGQTTDDVSYTGDTKNAGTNTTIDRMQVVVTSSSRLADVYILNDTGTTNNNFLGDVTVRTLSPVGDGTYSQLLGSDGDSLSNYLLVDEHPYSSTDYVGSGTTGQKDTYAMADLPNGVTTVYGVQLNGLMAKSDATLGQARLLLRTGGTDYGGTTRALTTTYTGYYDLYEINPVTAVQWTPTDVNGMESGMEVM